MPLAISKQRGKTKKRLIYKDFRCIVDTATLFGVTVAGFEKVGGVPGQSAPASFSFGYDAGLVFAALCEGLGFEPQGVPPAVWKRYHALPLAARIGRTEVKRASREKAVALWPDHAALFARAKDDGRAEACLIAEYLRAGHER